MQNLTSQLISDCSLIAQHAGSVLSTNTGRGTCYLVLAFSYCPLLLIKCTLLKVSRMEAEQSNGLKMLREEAQKLEDLCQQKAKVGDVFPYRFG